MTKLKSCNKNLLQTNRYESKFENAQGDEGSEITNEVEFVLKILKIWKSTRSKRTPRDMLKVIKEDPFRILLELFNIINRSNSIPSTWKSRQDVCFIDYNKAFDTIKYGHLIKLLREKNLDLKAFKITSNYIWIKKHSTDRIENCRRIYWSFYFAKRIFFTL